MLRQVCVAELLLGTLELHERRGQLHAAGGIDLGVEFQKHRRVAGIAAKYDAHLLGPEGHELIVLRNRQGRDV